MIREFPHTSTAAWRAPAEIRGWLAPRGRALVALSGGVDSATVALLTHDALRAEATAVTLSGPAVPTREVDRARKVAASIGIEHAIVEANPLADDDYRINPQNRCYFCRRTESSVLRTWGEPRKIAQYLDGVHVDDLSDYRPGIRALDEAGFQHPLAWAGWRKVDVREFAHEQGLPNWDQPSDACLASRIAHGQWLTADLLDRVRQAEERIQDLGFRRVRVRIHGEHANVVVDPVDIPRLAAEPNQSRMREALLAIGFRSIEIDPAGYRARPGA